MITIDQHRAGDQLNAGLKIFATDKPGPGGARHDYTIEWEEDGNPTFLNFSFQKGGVQQAGGINGLSNEALLAIVAHRLECFQAGPFACRENALALTKIQESLHWLHHRTRDRLARDVEGKQEA